MSAPHTFPLLALLLLAAASPGQWGADTNEGEGPKLINAARPALLAILQAPEDSRPEKIRELADGDAAGWIEALKRVRNPELRPLFVALLDHPDWHMQHRALFALEYYGGPDVLQAAWQRASAENARLREKAVITCIKRWDRAAADALGPDPAAAVQERLRVEEDFHVRRCLEALALRIEGRLPVEKVYEEIVVDDGGLLLTPFLSGMNNLASLAPGARLQAQHRTGGGSASKLPPADRWETPLLGYADEEVKGTSLQPFANLRSNGTVYHTGQDVGSSLDGAGFYALADGIVQLVSSGTDMGTLLVVQYPLPGKETVNSVYMHGGDTVFVEAGDRVTCGQLLGTMGMGYSAENGGHFAHLHFGLYPGSFSLTHNYGYKPVSSGLADWYDPAVWLPPRVERTRPVIPELHPRSRELARAMAALAKGDLGKAYREASKVASNGEEEARPEAETLVAALTEAPGRLLERAALLRDTGYPSDALALLKIQARACKGLPGVDTLAEAAKKWPRDDAMKKALRAEEELNAVLRNLEAVEKKGGKDAVRQMWQDLLSRHEQTGVAARIRERLEQLEK